MILEKRFRIVYDEEENVIVSGEFSTDSKTIVGKGKFGKEFDTEEELINFIDDNSLNIEGDGEDEL